MKVEGNLWIDINGAGSATQGRVRLLELIEETGSINKAASAMGISYKTAWDHINTLNELYSKDIVERKTGGKGGGGTVLTEHGRTLIKTYNYYSRIHELYLTDISQMNCIHATVKTTDGRYASAETPNGDTFHCVLLDKDIKDGDKVSLFIKPSDIILINRSDFATSAKNIVKTSVKMLEIAEEKCEILLSTEKGSALTVRITAASAEKMGLAKGAEIYALFKTASVLAVSL